MTRHVVITDCDFGSGELEREELGRSFTLAVANARTEDEVISAAADADGVLVQWAPMTERVLAELPRLRAIVRYGIGLDTIDLIAASRRGVQVMNVPDYCVDEVASHAHAMIAAANRNLFEYAALVASGGWWQESVAVPHRPSSDPVGIVGLGRIGTSLAARLTASGHPVYYWDPFVSSAPLIGLRRLPNLVELATTVNHLSLHVPVVPETIGLIDQSVLEALGPAGHLVNTGRGALVREQDLLDALDGGYLGRASLDVLAMEPPSGVSARLAAHPRVRVTPHVAYLSDESLPTLRRTAARKLREALA